jgi:hypothetical protein
MTNHSTEGMTRSEVLEELSAGYHHGHTPQDRECLYSGHTTYPTANCARCADHRRMYPKEAA